MKLKDKARSISQKLSNIAQKRNTAYLNVLTEFLIERLLVRIVADEKLREALVFKGGFVGLKIYSSPRYTVDLDAVLHKADLRTILDGTRKAAERDLGDVVWFRFEKEVNLTAQGKYGGIRLLFRAGIGEILKDLKRAQIINFDLGIGDPITPGPVQEETPTILEKDPIHWQVYPIETVVAEKIHALVDRGNENSRSKDVFDLHLFLPKSDKRKLQVALKACFKYRDTKLSDELVAELKKINLAILTKGWASATSAIKEAPSCEEAFRQVLDELEKLTRA